VEGLATVVKRLPTLGESDATDSGLAGQSVLPFDPHYPGFLHFILLPNEKSCPAEVPGAVPGFKQEP
jgi:hypothetical protein